MAKLKINQLESVVRHVVAEEPMWLNSDRSKLVPEGDPEAAFLFATPGKRIDLEEAVRYGLVKGEVSDQGDAGDLSKLKAAEVIEQLGELNDEQLEALAKVDERKGVQKAIAAEQAGRAESGDDEQDQ